MEILLGAIIALAGIGLVLISRSVTTFFHELGHALPALLFTDGPVIIYVGSYGDAKDNWKWQIGRLTIYLRFNFLAWDLGLCTHKGSTNFLQEIIITLAGPLASLLLALSLINFWINQQLEESIILILAIFITSSIWDFIINLVPRSTPMPLQNGSMAYSDGYQLVKLFREARYPDLYFKALEQFNKKNYTEAASAFESVMNTGVKSRFLANKAIQAALLSKNYEQALRFFDQYQTQFRPKNEDFVLLGKIYYGLKQYEQALHAYNQAWYYRVADQEAMIHRGKLLLHFGETELALQDFNTAILYNPNYGPAYAERGLARIQAERMEGAGQDAELALHLGADKGLCYFVLGKYYEHNRQYGKALEYYQKAKEENFYHHGLDFFIEDMKKWL